MARRRTAHAYRGIARIEEAADARAREIAQWVVERIAVLAPRDPLHHVHTGGPALYESYYIKADPDGDGYTIRSRRRYWVYVEFGTRKMREQPHVRVALDEAKARFG
jgi:hypothetical protein